MGSEMCIRDRPLTTPTSDVLLCETDPQGICCLLYTSDAADDMQCVDLGGRRIIKKRFFQAEDGIRDVERSRGLGDVYKRQCLRCLNFTVSKCGIAS